ncbi:hypothetical protein PI124_g21093 [Phytophthora idaei]|nr:hypothetical protein PI125_g23034 [Phytophthora idaei]KAG3233841.1 hypothetical protein PI124_g21093 [Phytophthora idaei]
MSPANSARETVGEELENERDEEQRFHEDEDGEGRDPLKNWEEVSKSCLNTDEAPDGLPELERVDVSFEPLGEQSNPSFPPAQ